jgi:DNA-binding SARP family transcriptional activator
MTPSNVTPPPPTLSLFGNLTITQAGHTKAANKKPLLVPAAVALHPNRRLHRDDLARLVWPDQGEAKARLSLRQARYQINEWCDTPCLIFEGDFLTIAPGATVDLWQFEEAIAEGRAADAIELHTGHLLQSMIRRITGQFASEIEARNIRVQTQLRGAYQDLIRLHLTEGRLDEGKRLAREIAKQEPLDERTQTQLIETLRACGDYRAALAAYAGYRSLLESELGDVPSEYLEEVVDEIREAMHTSTPPLPRLVAASQAASAKVADLAVKRIGVAFSAGLLASALIAHMAWPRPTPWPAGVTLDLPLTLAGRSLGGGAGPVGVDVSIAEGSVTLGEPFEQVMNAVGQAGSSMFAHALNVPGGYDLAVTGPDGTSVVRSERADEHPLAWGPEQRRVVFRTGETTEEGYRMSLRSVDLDSGAEVELGTYMGRRYFNVDWSPTGTVLAVVTGERWSPPGQLVLMSPQGDVFEMLPTAAEDRPTWSPRGTRVAFVERTRGWDAIMSLDSNGEDLRSHLQLPARLNSPVWLTERIIIFVADFGFGGDVWALDAPSQRLAQITQRQDVQGLRASEIDPSGLGWLDDVTVARLGSVTTLDEIGVLAQDLRLGVDYAPAPGEYFSVEASATWEGGARTVLRPSALEWTGDAAVATSGIPGLFRRTSETGGVIGADYGGWIQASLELPAVQLVEGVADEVFADDWSGDPLNERWIPFGQPPPTVDREERVFLNNGDQNFISGAVSRARFDISDGLSVEVEGRVPLTGGLFQAFGIGLVSDSPESSDSPEFRGGGHVRLAISNDGVAVFTGTTIPVSRIPLPDSMERVHTYGLQLAPDGQVTVTVDGSVYVRTRVNHVPDSTRVMIGGNMLGTRIEHGAVRVYRGARVVVR